MTYLEEVINAVRSLKNGTFPSVDRLDQVSGEMVKCSAHVIAPSLTTFFNANFIQDEIPEI